jgi:peptide/nickel transport system substrate-binding protein
MRQPPNILTLLTTIFLTGMLALNAQADTLRMALRSMPPGNANPHTSGGWPPLLIWPALFEPLTAIGEDGALGPLLATSWHHENETTWIFELRDNILFSNGEPLNAAAAAATINYLLSDEGRTFSAYRELRTVASASARNRLTLEVKTTQPDSMIPGRLAGVRILPPQYFADVGPETFALEPHGTGPFMVERWKTGRASLIKNPNAWRPAQVDRIEYTAAPDSTARIQALISDAVDIAFDLGATDIFQVERAGARVDYRTRASVQMWQFVTEQESPLNDKRVRKALNYAVNIDVIVEALLQGIMYPASQVAAHGTFGFDDTLAPYPYDPAKARALLTEAGYPDGFSIPFQVAASSAEEESVYIQVAQDLKHVGVDVELIRVPFTKQVQSVYGAPWDGLAFNMNYGSLPSLDPLASMRYHSCLWPWPWICRQGIADRTLAADREFNPDARRQIVRSILRDLHDDPPGIYLYENVHVDGISNTVTTYEAPYGFIQYHTLELSD